MQFLFQPSIADNYMFAIDLSNCIIHNSSNRCYENINKTLITGCRETPNEPLWNTNVREVFDSIRHRKQVF